MCFPPIDPGSVYERIKEQIVNSKRVAVVYGGPYKKACSSVLDLFEESITACFKTAMVLEFFLDVAFSDSSFTLSL